MNYWWNRRRGTATWSQGSVTSLLSASIGQGGDQLLVRYRYLELEFSNVSAVSQAEARDVTNYWSNRRRGMATWSQDSVTSLLSAIQRPGMRLNTGRIGGEVRLSGVRIQ